MHSFFWKGELLPPNRHKSCNAPVSNIDIANSKVHRKELVAKNTELTGYQWGLANRDQDLAESS